MTSQLTFRAAFKPCLGERPKGKAQGIDFPMSSTLIMHIHNHELPAVSILAHLRWWTNFYLQLQSIVDNFKKVVLLYGPGMFTVIQTSVLCSKDL